MTDVSKIKISINKGNIKETSKIFERIGRLKQKYPSMAQYYNITVIQDEVSKIVTDLIWSKKQIREERTVLSGCYVIETTHKEYDAVETWKLYMTLTNVEGAFRSLK